MAVDVANGMATLYRGLLEELNLELVPLFFGLDGSFPNHEANPLKPENLRDLQNAVREKGCALGIAFDGDADRAILVDDRCGIVGADMVTALLARPMLERFPGAADRVRHPLLVGDARGDPGRRWKAGARAGRPLLHEGDHAPHRQPVRGRARRPLLLPRELLRRLLPDHGNRGAERPAPDRQAPRPSSWRRCAATPAPARSTSTSRTRRA